MTLSLADSSSSSLSFVGAELSNPALLSTYTTVILLLNIKSHSQQSTFITSTTKLIYQSTFSQHQHLPPNLYAKMRLSILFLATLTAFTLAHPNKKPKPHDPDCGAPFCAREAVIERIRNVKLGRTANVPVLEERKKGDE
jgi:hypothetical protein